MEALDGTTIFWLIALGMIAGALIQLFIWDKGIGFATNVVTGVIGTLVVGTISIMLQFPGQMMLAFLGSLAILFISNVFNLKREVAH